MTLLPDWMIRLPNVKNLSGILLRVVLAALALFVSAGRLDLPMLWAYFCVYTGSCLAIRCIIFKRDPDLVRERTRPRAGTRRWDRRLMRIIQVVPFAIWSTAGLDAGRLHWTDTVPYGVQIAALAGVAASAALMLWAMAANSFYSRWIRIQRERGHRLVTAGPYRCVRHPGYSGNILFWVCGALSLGSWLAVAPAAAIALLLVVRTAREDRILREELADYATYAGNVRYRLLPGLW